MDNYLKKALPVQAMLYRGSRNDEELMAFVGEHCQLRPGRSPSYSPSHGTCITINNGTWVVKEPDGTIGVYSRDGFARCHTTLSGEPVDARVSVPEIVRAIETDLRSRSGIKQVWDALPPATQQSIRDSMAVLIRDLFESD